MERARARAKTGLLERKGTQSRLWVESVKIGLKLEKPGPSVENSLKKRPPLSLFRSKGNDGDLFLLPALGGDGGLERGVDGGGAGEEAPQASGGNGGGPVHCFGSGIPDPSRPGRDGFWKWVDGVKRNNTFSVDFYVRCPYFQFSVLALLAVHFFWIFWRFIFSFLNWRLICLFCVLIGFLASVIN